MAAENRDSVFPLRWYQAYSHFFILLPLIPLSTGVYNLFRSSALTFCTPGIFLYLTVFLLVDLYLISLGISAGFGLSNFTERGFRQNRILLFATGIYIPVFALSFENILPAFFALLIIGCIWSSFNLVYFEKRRYLFFSSDPVPVNPATSSLNSDVKRRLVTVSLLSVALSAALGFGGLLTALSCHEKALDTFQSRLTQLKETNYQKGYQSGKNDGEKSGYKKGFAEGEKVGSDDRYVEGYDEGYNDGYDEGIEAGLYEIPDLHLINCYWDNSENIRGIACKLLNTTSKTCRGWKITIEMYIDKKSVGIYYWTWDNNTISPGSTFTATCLIDGEMAPCNRYVIRSIEWMN